MNRTLFERLNRHDEDFLNRFVYKLLVRNATIHDSYHCRRFADSEPFPTKRKLNEYVGAIKSSTALSQQTETVEVCPIECRPPENLDWTYC